MINSQLPTGRAGPTPEARCGFRLQPEGLCAQPRQRVGKHGGAVRDRFRRGVLIRPVADAAAAGDEDHAGRRQPRHEQGIVVRTADHSLVAQAACAARRRDRLDDLRRARGRRVRIQRLDAHPDATARRDLVAGGPNAPPAPRRGVRDRCRARRSRYAPGSARCSRRRETRRTRRRSRPCPAIRFRERQIQRRARSPPRRETRPGGPA